MSWIVGGFVVLALLVIGGAVAHRAYLHWLLDRTGDELPVYRVLTLDAPPGTTRARLTLGGTDRALELRRLSVHGEGARRVGLRPPDGFEAVEGEGESGRLAWRPAESLVFAPGDDVELTFGYDPSADGTVPVFGYTEARAGLGGIGAGFTVLVGPRAPLEVEASNLRSSLLARARERKVPPRTLPEWARLEEIEARLAAGTGDPERAGP